MENSYNHKSQKNGGAIPGIPPTYNRNTWDQEVDGIKWYVEWKEKDIHHETAGRKRYLPGIVRLNYFPTQKAAHDFIRARHALRDYEWLKEPGWEQEVS